jgi:hypothetical protein
MKKTYFILLAMLLANSLAFAQTNDFDQFVNKYKHQKGFTYGLFSKESFEVTLDADVEDKDWQKVQQIVKDLGHLTILAGEELDYALDLYNEARDLVQADAFDELITVRDGNDRVRIWSRDNGKEVEDIVMIVVSDKDFVLISFTGKIDLAGITQLSSLINADAAQRLARSGEQVQAQMAISPNPSSGQFNLTFDANDGLPTTLSVRDATGKVMKELQLGGQLQTQIDLQDLPTGNYYLQIRTDKGKLAVKQVQVIK